MVGEYEQLLGGMAYRPAAEKSYVDKLLSRREVEALKQLVGKEDLTKKELAQFMYMITAIELKLANFNEMDRYILGKFFTWIREFIMLSEFTYDYVDKMQAELKSNIDKNNKAGASGVQIDITNKEIIIETLQNIKTQQLHNVKFIADLYLYLIRSTMALGSVTFDSLSKNRYEYEYAPNQMPPPEAAQMQQKGGLWPFRR